MSLSEHLSTLLGEVLKNPAYRANAHKHSASCRTYGKVQQAIAETNTLLGGDLMEEALGLTKTVGNSNTKPPAGVKPATTMLPHTAFSGDGGTSR